MKKIIKDAMVLFIITLVAGVLLIYDNQGPYSKTE